MKPSEIKIGKWYLIKKYGFETGVKGKAKDVVGDIVLLSFYWGGLFRSIQGVEASRLEGECKRPSLFSNH